MATTQTLEATRQTTTPPELWYAPHRHLRTAGAAQRARELADILGSSRAFEDESGEQDLFVAMHTCAFRAKHAGSDDQDDVDGNPWVERWETIRSAIVERNLGLVYSMIGRFGSRQLDEDDLLSEAMYALTRAVDRFNPWRGYKFSTYACNVIARALMRRGKQENNYRRLFPVQHDMTYEKPSAPPDASSELYRERLRRILDHNIGELTDLETTILSHRFPNQRQPRLTFQEIGHVVGLSKERVRQIQNIALDKLREALELDPVLK